VSVDETTRQARAVNEAKLRHAATEGPCEVRLVPPVGVGRSHTWLVLGVDAAIDLARVLAAGHRTHWVYVSEAGRDVRMVLRVEPSEGVKGAASGH